MIRIELRTPRVDREEKSVEWAAIASLCVNGDVYELDDPNGVLDLTLSVLDLRTGRNLRFDEDPEEWTRGLPTAYRGGELIAAILHDDNPIPDTDATVEREPVSVPEAAVHDAAR